MKQEQLDSIRKGAELGTGMTLADIEGESTRDILGVYLQMSHAILSLVDEVERLQKPQVDEWTGEVLSEVEAREERAESWAEFGPIHLGDTVQTKVDIGYAKIKTGEIGKLTYFDRWIGEEYPYHATFEGGRTAAFAREDIRRVD